MTQVAERCVAMDDLNLFPNEDVPKNWEGREHCRKGRRSIYDPVGDVVNLEAVCQVSYSSSTRVWGAVCMGNDDYPMASIDQFLACTSARSTVISTFPKCKGANERQNLRWQRDRCDSRLLLVVDKRNPRSSYVTLADLLHSKSIFKDQCSLPIFDSTRTRCCKASWRPGSRQGKAGVSISCCYRSGRDTC